MSQILKLCLLKSRSLIKLQGSTSIVTAFLQGLITNDISHFEHGSRSIYTMFLNPRGRLLFDSLIYSTLNPDTYLIECDSESTPILLKHLQMYKLRRDIDINSCPDKIWSLIGSVEFKKYLSDSIFSYIDPRGPHMGTRLITPELIQSEELLNILGDNISVEDLSEYKKFRYELGIAEGLNELPKDSTFPLEANCDYLHGVSFHKGCYIGQELTARTHHTGVIRKRYMPLVFKRKISFEIPTDTPIFASNNTEKAIGKVRGISQDVGIGLLRVSEALEAQSLIIMGEEAKTFRPKWWPTEMTKNKRFS